MTTMKEKLGLRRTTIGMILITVAFFAISTFARASEEKDEKKSAFSGSEQVQEREPANAQATTQQKSQEPVFEHRFVDVTSGHGGLIRFTNRERRTF